ncbi:MAG: rhomboid family intramembrane serine protease [Candidatus Woesearchaeota archaeon]
MRATISIIGVCMLVYLLQITIEPFTGWFILDTSAVFFERFYTLVTSMFLHSLQTPSHIIFNMLFFFFMGSVLEQILGIRRFVLLYFLAGIIAAIGYSLIPPPSLALGASGAVMGVAGALIRLRPKMKVLIWGVIPMPLWMFGIFLILFDLFAAPANVAITAHFIGLGFGFLFASFIKEKSVRARRVIGNKFELDESDLQDYLRNGRI